MKCLAATAVLLLLTVSALAQKDLFCGKVRSGELSVPSYKFVVVDKEGNQIEDLRIRAEVMITEKKWGHNYGDWNWEDVDHNIPIPVSFDPKEGVYVSQAIPNVKVAFRKGRGQANCLDMVKGFYFQFTKGEMTPTTGYQGMTGSTYDVLVPDSTKPIKITLKNGDGTKVF